VAIIHPYEEAKENMKHTTNPKKNITETSLFSSVYIKKLSIYVAGQSIVHTSHLIFLYLLRKIAKKKTKEDTRHLKANHFDAVYAVWIREPCY